MPALELRTPLNPTKSYENPPKSGPGAPLGCPGDAPGSPGAVLEVLGLGRTSGTPEKDVTVSSRR